MDTLTRSGRVWDLAPARDDDAGRVWGVESRDSTRISVGALPPLVTTVEVQRRRRRRRAFALVAALALLVGALTTVGAVRDRISGALDNHVITDGAHVDPADLPLGSMYHVVDQIGARDLWAQGITGAGVNVAVIDTGVAPVSRLGSEKVVAMVDLTSEAADPAVTASSNRNTGRWRVRERR